jgi:hypothetical protein
MFWYNYNAPHIHYTFLSGLEIEALLPYLNRFWFLSIISFSSCLWVRWKKYTVFMFKFDQQQRLMAKVLFNFVLHIVSSFPRFQIDECIMHQMVVFVYSVVQWFGTKSIIHKLLPCESINLKALPKKHSSGSVFLIVASTQIASIVRRKAKRTKKNLIH